MSPNPLREIIEVLAEPLRSRPELTLVEGHGAGEGRRTIVNEAIQEAERASLGIYNEYKRVRDLIARGSDNMDGYLSEDVVPNPKQKQPGGSNVVSLDQAREVREKEVVQRSDWRTASAAAALNAARSTEQTIKEVFPNGDVIPVHNSSQDEVTTDINVIPVNFGQQQTYQDLGILGDAA